jgi:hypothetical protein
VEIAINPPLVFLIHYIDIGAILFLGVY